MVNREIRQQRANDVLQRFVDGDNHCVFFTLTTADVVDYETIRERWRNLRHWLARMLGKNARYVMNFELHPRGHGWHIHSVWNRYIDLRRHLNKIQSFGFGRLDVRRVNSVGVADYLTKHALKAYRGVSSNLMRDGKRLRLVNCSRGLPVLSDYRYQSEHLSRVRVAYRFCLSSMPPQKPLDKVRLYSLCNLAVLGGVDVPSLVLGGLIHNQSDLMCGLFDLLQIKAGRVPLFDNKGVPVVLRR